MLGVSELESETIVELPDRELLGGTAHVTQPLIGVNIGEISVLENLANNSFNNWHVNILDNNDIDVDVQDNLSQNDLDVFCNQVVAVLSAQCKAELT